MKEYKFEIYYEYTGPSPLDPLKQKKDAKEIQDALRNFENGLPHYLAPLDSFVSSEKIDDKGEREIVTIQTTAEHENVKGAVAKCLQDLDLLGKIIK